MRHTHLFTTCAVTDSLTHCCMPSQFSFPAAILKIDISPYLSEKSSDFHEILYTAADFFELDERHVIKNEKVALDRH